MSVVLHLNLDYLFAGLLIDFEDLDLADISSFEKYLNEG